ncbi:VanZ family protein [Nocardiopsis sp. NPDC101807]|uniref:VanZ family protein n=1 Tax=Nocardiopsis sp. NPDC101807 TaxID=3364339 RepID=UPI00382D4431
MAILLLFALSLVLAAAATRSQDSFPRHTRKLLAVTVSVYVLVLVMPFSGVSAAGPGRSVHWNPLGFVNDLAVNEAVEESFGQQLTDGTVAHYSPEELTDQEKEEIQGTNPTDFYVHGDPDRGLFVVDGQGGPVSHAQENLVLTELSEGIGTAGEPMQYAALILEEKAMNALLFVPLGILAFFAFSPWWARLSFGPALSVSVETLQWAAGADRVADAGDVLANSSGFLVGVGMAAVSAALLARLPGESRSPVG